MGGAVTANNHDLRTFSGGPDVRAQRLVDPPVSGLQSIASTAPQMRYNTPVQSGNIALTHPPT